MTANEVLSLLNERLSYEKETGYFRWLINRGGKARAGCIAGKRNSAGHVQIMVGDKLYLAHRLAWLAEYGRWPTEIDHINGIKNDNRLCNLREATRIQNLANRPAPKNNTSGMKGVSWHKKQRQWVAGMTINGKKKYLGGFDDAKEAQRAFQDFARSRFGEFYHS